MSEQARVATDRSHREPCQSPAAIDAAARAAPSVSRIPPTAHGLTDALRDAELLAGHRWADDEIAELLLRLSDATSEEVALLGGLDVTTGALR